MTDVIFDTQRVDPAWEDTLRPSKIPTIDGFFGADGQTSLSIKQSQFGVKGLIPIENMDPIKFRFDFDLFGVGVDAGQTTMRIRHVYGEWGPILAGQTNSVFMDIDVWPNIIDYWGPCGMVFYRNVQVRWTVYQDPNSSAAIAIERPGNDIDAGQIREIDPDLGENITHTEHLPDLTAHYRYFDDRGHVQIAGILRQISFETLDVFEPISNEPRGSEFGWGVNLGAHLNTIERDKLTGQIVFGEGIASYMNDGGTDLAPAGRRLFDGTIIDAHAEAVPLVGMLVYYDHYWDWDQGRWSSSIGYSFTQVDNTSLQAADAFHKGEYASVNLLWVPDPSILFGGELLWGEREDNDGQSGEDVRFQFSVKYAFGAKI